MELNRELKIRDVRLGDVLLFVRPDPESAKPQHFAGLHWLITVFDEVPFSHVAVVTDAPPRGAPAALTISHSDGARFRTQPLDDIHEEYGGAPMFVARLPPGSPRTGAAAAAAAEELVSGGTTEYPHADLFLGIIEARLRKCWVAPFTEDDHRVVLDAIAQRLGPNALRLMCAAFAADATGIGARGLERPDADPSVARFLANRAFWQRSAPWVLDAPPDGDLLVPYEALVDVARAIGLTGADVANAIGNVEGTAALKEWMQNLSDSPVNAMLLATVLASRIDEGGAAAGPLNALADTLLSVLPEVPPGTVRGKLYQEPTTAYTLLHSRKLDLVGHVPDWGPG